MSLEIATGNVVYGAGKDVRNRAPGTWIPTLVVLIRLNNGREVSLELPGVILQHHTVHL